MIKFHSRYKYLIMAYSQVAYRELGRDIANFSDAIPLEEVASKYQEKLMKAFSVAANREGQTNALMHMAGYFKRDLSSQQKKKWHRQFYNIVKVSCLYLNLMIYSNIG